MAVTPDTDAARILEQLTQDSHKRSDLLLRVAYIHAIKIALL